MSEESTTPDLEDKVRRSIDAFPRGDFDAVMSPYTPNAVWDMSAVGLGVYEGREAIRGYFEEWRGSYEDFEQVLEEFHDLGNGVTLAVIRQRARLRSSSGFVEQRYPRVAIWSDALLERATTYNDIDEARAAAERLAEERE